MVVTAEGDRKTADGGASKRAELLMKYKAVQKQNHEASISKTKQIIEKQINQEAQFF